MVARRNIGLPAYAAGLGVHVVDRLGLSDPIAARVRLTARTRPGHEKSLPDAWVIARFVSPDPSDAPAVVAAREALACGDLKALEESVGDPLTAKRFLTNLRSSLRLHRLRIPADPLAARAELCSERPVPGTIDLERSEPVRVPYRASPAGVVSSVTA